MAMNTLVVLFFLGLFGDPLAITLIYDLIKEYPAGAQVPVFYNPRNPKASCLRKEGWFGIYILFFGGLFFFYAGYHNLWR